MQVVANSISRQIMSLHTQLCDQEWRIFKEWQRVIPEEPFYAFKYESIKKRATK